MESGYAIWLVEREKQDGQIYTGCNGQNLVWLWPRQSLIFNLFNTLRYLLIKIKSARRSRLLWKKKGGPFVIMVALLYEQNLSIFGYLAVGICWGTTNPFIKRATMAKGLESTNDNTGKMMVQSHLETLKQFCLEPRIFLPFLINQSGSVVYYLLLSKEPISRAAPICNALTFLFTAITGYIFLKEEIRSPILLILGSLLVLCGIFLCCGGL